MHVDKIHTYKINKSIFLRKKFEENKKMCGIWQNCPKRDSFIVGGGGIVAFQRRQLQDIS